MPRRHHRHRCCLICLGRVGNSPHHPCTQCRQVCHQDCFRAWRRTRDDLDFRALESTSQRAACPLCNVPKPYEDRFCPGCGIAFVRIGGCDRMQCAACNHQFDFRDAPRQQPNHPIYSALEIWWWGGPRRNHRIQAPLRWCIYILVGILVSLLVNLLLVTQGATTTTTPDAWDRVTFCIVFGGLAATQLMIHWEGIPELGATTSDIAVGCYCLLLAICGGSLILKIVMSLLVALTPEFLTS